MLTVCGIRVEFHPLTVRTERLHTDDAGAEVTSSLPPIGRRTPMLYKIKYANGKCSNYANGRKDLLDWLELLKDEVITDILKIEKNGETCSVMKSYKKYLKKYSAFAERKGTRF